MKLYLKTAIEVNDKDKKRCAFRCQHLDKLQGLYTCTLFDEVVDTGKDDELGYGLQRTKDCLKDAYE